eukprot:2774204-Pyramimonas_sp.AAC.1
MMTTKRSHFEDGDFYAIPGMTHKLRKDMMSVKQQKKGNYLWEVVTAEKVRVTVEVFHRVISD